MKNTKWSGWEFTDANNNSPCPKCNAKPKAYCRTPKGKKAKTPHIERLIKFKELFPEYNANIKRL